MMSILTGLILVVVLGAIVQKSDTLMDAFSGFTEDETEEASASADSTPAPGESDPLPGESEAVSGESAASEGERPAAVVEKPPGGAGAAPPREVASAVPAEVRDYRALFDDVDVLAGGTYAIDVLGNDIGVRPDTYGRLELLSVPQCGIAQLHEGSIAYFADQLCLGAQKIYYCIEGADPRQCEEGVLTIHVLPGSATLDPAGLLRDVSPGAEGVYLPDRSPMVDTSVPAPVIGGRPGAMPAVRPPRAVQSALTEPRAADGFGDAGAVLAAAAPKGGLFVGNVADDAAPPAPNEAVDRPDEVALLDDATEAAPLAGTRRAAAGRGLELSPLPVAKPALIDRASPEAPQVAGAKGLQDLAQSDAAAPSGGAASTRVTMRDVAKAELLVQRRNEGPPPYAVSVAASGLTAPDTAGDTPEIAALSAAEIRDANAMTLNRTDYASVASMVRGEAGGAVAVNRIARLPGAPEGGTPAPDAKPGSLGAVAVEKGAGGAGGFALRDRAAVADQADAAQPLTTFLSGLSSAPPEGVSQGLGRVRFEDPVEGGAAAGRRDAAEARGDAAAQGAFTLRDQPAKAIPRESLMVESGGASSETPKIAPVEIAALNRDDPARMGGGADRAQGVDIAALGGADANADPNAAGGGLRRGPAAEADCEIRFSAVGARGALIRAEAASPCRAGQVIRFVHHGLEFATRFDAAGFAEALLPALERDAVVLARTEDAEEAYARAAAPGMGRVSRVVLAWTDPVDLNLHAFEYGAGPGAKGHLWEGARPDLTNFKRGRTGLIQVFRPIDGFGDNVEVYSFAPGLRSTEGSVEIAVEFASRGETPAAPYCGDGVMASPRFTLLRLENGRLNAPTEAAFAAAPCGAALSGDARYVRGLAENVVVSR